MFSPDSISVDLGQQAEDAWLRLRRHLDWSHGFSLTFLFFATPRLAAAFCARLEQVYRGRVSQLQTVKPINPEAALVTVMGLVRDYPPLLDEMAAPLWIDLQEHPDDAAWEQARELLLARLNEHRELLRRMRRPVIVALPGDYHAKVRELAPDLWSIRDFSRQVTEQTSSAAVPTVPRREAEPEAAPFDDTLLDEWRRLSGKGVGDENAIGFGWRVIQGLLNQQRLDEAAAVADAVLAQARNADDPRLAAVSLIYRGDVASAQGRLEEAGHAYQEALALLRRLDYVFPGQEYGGWLQHVEQKYNGLMAKENDS